MLRPTQATRRRRRPRRLGSPPRSLVLLLAIVAVAGLSWALVVPPWQSPDEVAHFAYVQSIAEGPMLPGAADRPEISSDQLVADEAVGADRGAFHPDSVPPNWSAAAQRAYLAIERGPSPPSRTNGGGPNPASGYPPVYYLGAAAGYLLDDGGTPFGRLYTIRICEVVLALATALGAWLLAGETFGRRRLPQLTTAAFAGLLPMTDFDIVSISPDALMIPLWTIALWLGARVINHRARTRDALWLCAVTAVAILTKPTSYALVPPLVLALVIGWRRRPRNERPAAARRLAGTLAVLVVPVLAWFAIARALARVAIPSVGPAAAGPGAAVHPFIIKQFIDYVWQFYLPRLPFMTPDQNYLIHSLPIYGVWIHQLAGLFGWLVVPMPAWVYPVAGWTAAVVAAASLGVLIRRRLAGIWALLAYYIVVAVSLLGLLHLTDYLSQIANGGPILQGRYLLPVIALIALPLGLVVSRVPSRVRPVAAGLILAALLGAQFLSLARVLHAYYL